MKETLAFALGGAAIVIALAQCTGCQQVVPNLENAAAVAQYKVLLADCRRKGKEADSLAVYVKCADEVDAMLCRESAIRCPDGGQ